MTDTILSPHDAYVALVEAGAYPDDPRVPMRPDWYVNDAGAIENVLFRPAGTTSIIRSKRGAIRANHYHKTDSHYLYVVSGEVRYYWRKLGDTKRNEASYGEGATFFTPPLVEHAVLFTKPTVLLQLAAHVRTKDEHEADLVRVQLLTQEEAKQWM
jgi:quercetin dioxygenase-like cupin family protein